MAGGRKKSYHLYTKIGNTYVNERLFFSKQQTQANGCIHWTGARHVQGYGMCGGIRVDTDERFMTVTHRMAMTIHLGRELVAGENVIHHVGCEPQCVNPNHLQIGDLRLRNQVMMANGHGGHIGRNSGRYSRDMKKQNRVYRYTIEEMLYIRRENTRDIAARFGWDRTKASRIRWEMRKGYNWLKEYENK